MHRAGVPQNANILTGLAENARISIYRDVIESKITGLFFGMRPHFYVGIRLMGQKITAPSRI
jgi:hypothetical protein